MQSRLPHDSRIVAWIFCIFLFPTMLSGAISLPLGGYYKPGRFFPILVDANDAAHSNLFMAEGCFSSSSDSPANGRAIVPMLATGSPRELHWNNGSLTLQAPADDERLIGTTLSSAALAAPLFAGDRLIPIHLQTADVLAAPPAVWESLDAILLDSASYQQMSDAQISGLLSGGIFLVATGDHAPDSRWPWRRQGPVWILHCRVAGPTDELVNEAAYVPTLAWHPGWSVAVRWQVMGVATLFTLFSISLVLRQNRFTSVAVFGFALFAAAGVLGWRWSLGNINRVGGDILVNHPGLTQRLTQRDAWVYQRARESSSQTVRWTGWTHPIFSSVAALSSSKMQLSLSSAGELAFVYQVLPLHTMAFVRREVQPEEILEVIAEHQSPMQDLARSDYLHTGDQITGQIPPASGRWAGVVIDAKGKDPETAK